MLVRQHHEELALAGFFEELEMLLQLGLASCKVRGILQGIEQLPVARRDVTGDGNVETIYDDNCSTYVESKDGAPLFSSYMRCCGC